MRGRRRETFLYSREGQLNCASVLRSCSRGRFDSDGSASGSVTDLSSAPSCEVSFAIRKHLGNKQGWKIMPEGDSGPKAFHPESLKRVVGMIKEMELKGHAVPERITIKV